MTDLGTGLPFGYERVHLPQLCLAASACSEPLRSSEREAEAHLACYRISCGMLHVVPYLVWHVACRMLYVASCMLHVVHRGDMLNVAWHVACHTLYVACRTQR